DRATLGAGAVVAVDVDDEGVIESAHVFDGLDNTTNFVVVVGLIGGEDLVLLDKELLFLGRAIVPILDDLRWPRLYLGVRRDHPKTLLVLKNLLTKLVPALVEQVHVVNLVHPFLGRMMRRVRGAGNVVAEEWLARIDLINAVQVINGLIGHAGDQVPTRLAFEGINLRRVAE